MIDSNTLNAFEPFSDLDEQTKLVAIKTMSVESENKGTVLFDVGDNDDLEYFLVSGEIELTASDRVKKKIRSVDPVARFPLALLRPRKFSAVITSEKAEFIKLDVDVLRSLKNSVPVAGDAFSSYSSQHEFTFNTQDVDLDNVKHFLVSAEKAIAENTLTLGNFDSISGTIFNVINDPDVSLDTLTSAIQLDPSISAKIMKSANSAFFGGMEKVDTVRAAVVRLGLDLTVQLVTVMVMKEVFHSANENLQMAMNNLWNSSIKLGTFSVVVGKKSNCQYQQGKSLLAGMMSEIGALVIIAYLDLYPSSLQTLSDEILSSARIRRKLAKDLLIQWMFPEDMIEVVEKCEDYDRDTEQSDLVDVVLFAKLLVRMTAYRKLPVDDITQVPAYHRLGFDADNPEVIDEIIAESQRYAELFSGVAS